jgi:bile acid:Na+ symporter, BASS family
MVARARAPEWTAAHEQQAKRFALGMFLLVVTGAVVEGWGEATEHLGELAAAAITLNVLAMGVSFVIARLARLDDPSSTAISLELGIHNATLAIAIGATIATELTIPAAVYSAFVFMTAGLFARVMATRNERSAAPAPPLPEPA